MKVLLCFDLHYTLLHCYIHNGDAQTQQCYLSYFFQVNEKFSLLIYELIYMVRIVVCYSIALFIFYKCSVSRVRMLENSQPQICTAIILASHMYAISPFTVLPGNSEK